MVIPKDFNTKFGLIRKEMTPDSCCLWLCLWVDPPSFWPFLWVPHVIPPHRIPGGTTLPWSSPPPQPSASQRDPGLLVGSTIFHQNSVMEKCGFYLRLFQHTELEHTPSNLYYKGYNGIPFIVGQGDCLGCALGVCCDFLGF